MKTIEMSGKKVEIYDSIDEMPVIRFHRYNKMQLVDAGIGSGLDDVARHIERAICYARSKTPELAAVELENLRQNIHFIHSGVSPSHLSFAALVRSIDGKLCDDLSDEGLQRVADTLSDVTNSVMTAEIEAVKKKTDEELRIYFPKIFDDASMKEYYDMLRRRTLILLDTISEGESTEAQEKEMDELHVDMITYFNPQTFHGAKSVEVSYDKHFETMCLSLSQHIHVNPKKFTVLEYYNAYEYMRQMAREMKQLGKKR